MPCVSAKAASATRHGEPLPPQSKASTPSGGQDAVKLWLAAEEVFGGTARFGQAVGSCHEPQVEGRAGVDGKRARVGRG